MNPPPKHIDALMQACFSGKATQDQIQALETWLRESPSNVQWFVDLALLDGLILSVQKDEDAAAILTMLREAEEKAETDFSLLDPAPPSGPAPGVDERSVTFRELWLLSGYITKKALRNKAGLIGSVAAVVLLGAALFLYMLGGDPTPEGPLQIGFEPPASPVVATLTAERNAVWDRQPGEDLYAGQRYTLTQGFAEITTSRGAVAILEAPATVELLDNDNALRLHAGKLVGICETESSKGFVVRTPHLDITDIGTQFGVDATSKATEVYVIHGEVEVALPKRPGQDRSAGILLSQQQAVRLNAGGDTVVPITTASDTFERVLTTHPLAGTGVGNFTKAQAYPAWQIVRVDGVALPQAIDLRISGDDHSTGFAGDDRLGRWLNHRDERQPAEGSNHIVYTIQTEIVVPASVDLDRVTLNMLGYFDFSLLGLRFNDQLVKDLDVPKVHNEPLLFSMPASALGLRHGRNVVQFDIANDPDSYTGLLIQWRLTSIKAIGGTGL
ncbi:MAG: FecR family protein [Planctomycetota bacterium]